MKNQHDRLQDIFIEAVEKPAAERAAFLDQACDGNAELRLQLQRMIEADGSTGSFLRPPVDEAGPRFSAGAILSERFRVVRFIAAGGMGDVYEVEDIALHERLALKTIRPHLVGNQVALARFKREIQFAKRVTHPNVCRIHDLGTHLDGGSDVVFLTMQLLKGQTLSERLRASGRMDTEAALPLVVQMAEGLSAAHEAGIIHRDFKTSNVILTQAATGTKAVITDFGLARPTAIDDGASLTDSGKMVGTPAFMAPEQVTQGELTSATDVYALGLVMYEVITGRRPFPGNTPLESAVKRLTESPPPPSAIVPGLNPRWETAILRCLEREPARRYQNPREIVCELTDAPNATRTLTNMDAPRGWGGIRSRGAIAGITGLLVLFAAASGVWYFGRHRPSRDALRWYEEGTRALRDGTSFTAMNALDRAVLADPDFSLAHARLAEAATELDYTDKAKTEMLRASPPALQSFFLSGDERLRLEAVYFVLMKDFTRAAGKYRELAAKADPAERPAVLVDLGRAYEGGGQFKEALESYTESIERDQQFAAAFLRRAVLEGRQQLNQRASADFDVAEKLYRTEGKAEGLIEVLYQRAILLRRSGRLVEARAPAQTAFDMSRTSGDEYHQIRALLTLSFLSYNSGDPEVGRQQAQEAIKLSRRVGHEILEASAKVDVGNTLFAKGDYAGAEPYLREGLEAAKRFQAVRVEARAQLSLGQVLMKEGHTEEGVAVSKEAIENFQKSGDKTNAARAAIQPARNLRDQGEFEGAVSLFEKQLQLAAELKDDLGVALAAQGLGSTRLLQEKYPAALENFDRGAAASRAIADRSLEAYSEDSRAEALWRLGRYREAEDSLKRAEMLDQQLQGNKPLLAAIFFTRAGMELSRQTFGEAAEYVRRMVDSSGGLRMASAMRFRGAIKVATGHAKEGRLLIEDSVKLAEATRDVSLLRNAQLALAEARAQLGDSAGAKSLAVDLVEIFRNKHQGESELEALAVAFSTSRGDEQAKFGEQAKAALRELRKDLGEGFAGFCSRPDIHMILQRGSLLLEAK
jgi:tetratricopeptide (TPR) repeat protein/tRNA A-37 threonylcarbamoyl transferase component Bud32